MCSGKTSRLIDTLGCHLSCRKGMPVIITHTCDSRSNTGASTHNKLTSLHPANMDHIATDTLPTLDVLNKYDVIGVDEGQFFIGLVDWCQNLRECKKIVYVAGLARDCRDRHFGEMWDLTKLADRSEKFRAYCYDCTNMYDDLSILDKKKTATHSYRLVHSDEQILVGGCESYIPLCSLHYVQRNRFCKSELNKPE